MDTDRHGCERLGPQTAQMTQMVDGMGDLKDKVAIVTGGGRGIGRAVVEKLAAAGARVAAVARTGEEIDAVAREVEARGEACLARACDVSAEADVGATVQEVKAAFGPVDILVNNAGVFYDAPVCDTPMGEWRRLFEINVLGAVNCVRAVLPEMLERGAGRIVNVCSTASHRAYVGQSAYCASKHALLGLTRVLAAETHDTGVRVHAVSPGGVDTRLVRDSGRDVDLDAYMDPEEVADVILFLAQLDGKAQIDDVVIRRIGSAPR